MNNRGQMTIFIIIAIAIVAGIVIFFVFRDKVVEVSDIPEELAPVFDFYGGCIKQETRAAIDLAGTQGGYVDVPDYVPGSEYAPFSSQLNFLGFPVPYWYYVSGNGLIKEQVPSRSDMEKGIGEYLERRVNECDFEFFYEQGFDIGLDDIDARVNVGETEVKVDLVTNFVVSKNGVRASKRDHEVVVNSKLGKFYNLGREIYDKEVSEAFLEGYTVDVMRLYAPVDGVELTCASKIWKTRDVIEDLHNGLEANIAALKLEGNYYELDDDNDEYFVMDKVVDENVNFIYSRNWPSKIEIYGEGADEELLIAEPVGIQEGLGVMGFCYAPYHFVYDISIPVMVQIYNNDELFQFPVAVIVDKSIAREGLVSELEVEEEFDLCAFYNKDVEINVFDVNLNPVDEVRLNYKCFDQLCTLGETKNGKFVGSAPTCLNGFVQARKEGYNEVKEIFSTSEERVIDIIIDKEYNVEVELLVGGERFTKGTAIIVFDGDKTVTTALPEFKEVRLSEGNYEIRVYVYSDSEITIPGRTERKCQEILREGILGFFGSKKEECFDIVIPDTKIDYAIVGGGKVNTYLLESEIERGKVIIEVDKLPTPKNLEDLQVNFESFDSQGVDYEFV
jgi:hypothetical protein